VFGIQSDEIAPTRPSMLRTYDDSGVELTRFANAFQSVSGFRFSELLIDGAGVVALGFGDHLRKGLPSAMLIKIDSLDRQAARLSLLSALPVNNRYDAPFSVTIGLRATNGSVVQATRAVVVRVAAGQSSGGVVTEHACTITVGASECSVAGVRAHPLISGRPTTASLRLSADGYPSVETSTFNVSSAPTTTTITVLSPPPLQALSKVRYRIDVTAGNHSGLADTFDVPEGCTVIATASSVARYECSTEVRAPSTTFTHQYRNGMVPHPYNRASGAYLSSSGSLTPAVTRTAPVPVLEPAGLGNIQAGQYFSVRGWMTLPDGRDVFPNLLTARLLNATGTVLCDDWPVTANNGNIPTGMRTCEARETRVGSNPLALTTEATDQLLASSTAIGLTVTAASGVQGTISELVAGSPDPTVCGTTAGLNCSVTRLSPTSASYACDAPQNWQGRLFVKQSGYRFGRNGRLFGPLTAIQPRESVVGYGVVTSCSLDINRDGSVDVQTEASFLLKSLFGMARPADYLPLAHSCADASYSQAVATISDAKTSLDWDLDQDGSVSPLTDGLMMVRMMLGLYGSAVTEGALAPNAIRRDPQTIREYFVQRCGQPLAF
jgi:hypothetical protein